MYQIFSLAFILALIHFFSESYARHVERFHVQTVSFSAGLFLGVIFLVLFPEFFKGLEFAGAGIYVLLLVGFVLFHVGEKYIYQHIKDKDDLLKDLALVHAGGYFINHFVVGITLFLAFSYHSIVSGFLIFVPLMLHTFSSSLSLTHIDEHFNRKSLSYLILPLAPIFGVAFAALLQMNTYFYHLLFSFVLGAMLYIAIRDTLPKKEAGKPLFFVIGIAISLLAIMLS